MVCNNLLLFDVQVGMFSINRDFRKGLIQEGNPPLALPRTRSILCRALLIQQYDTHLVGVLPSRGWRQSVLCTLNSAFVY
jgi:hypothetical protein